MIGDGEKKNGQAKRADRKSTEGKGWSYSLPSPLLARFVRRFFAVLPPFLSSYPH